MENSEAGAPAPGLKYRPRSGGPIPYWIARADAVAAGYIPKSVNLLSLSGTPDQLAAKCRTLQGQMLDWLSGYRTDQNTFDGTIGDVLRIYETHDESPYRTLKPGSREPYSVYMRSLKRHVGSVRVRGITGLDVKRWHAVWSSGGKHPAAGKMALAVLKAALTFCIIAGHRECKQLREDIAELRVVGPRRRNAVMTADQVVAARVAAHARGRPSAAICYAFQFETALRLWDVIGQWFPVSAPFISTVIDGGNKWAGLEWRHIGADMVLRYRPSKTGETSGADVVIDLSLCPMVLEEIARIPAEARIGPMVVHERHGRPYRRQESTDLWTKVRKDAGIPEGVWCRDLRSSAITEARGGGATNDDGAKVAGHTKPTITSDVYDRANLEAHQRFATARAVKRLGNGVGNA